MLAGRIVISMLLLSAAVICDIREYRVSNLHTALGLIAGIALNFAAEGINGLVMSLCGAFIPAIALFTLYALRMMGAGDIKLFCAIGAISGIKFVIWAMAFSFLSGGLIALIIMLVKGNLRERMLYMLKYLRTCIMTGAISPYTDFNDKEDGAKFHFTFAIAAGCLITYIVFRLSYLQ